MGSVALHRSAKQWLDVCVNGSKIESALPSSEYWRERRYFSFYKHLCEWRARALHRTRAATLCAHECMPLWAPSAPLIPYRCAFVAGRIAHHHADCVLRRHAGHAKTALDVGSSLPPYLNALPWLQQRTILGPRFAGNVAKGGSELLSLSRIALKHNVTPIQADFLTWEAAKGTVPYDLVLCSEVVEHVPRPRAFVRKLLAVGKLVVLAVPYKWPPCDAKTDCHHVNNQITRSSIAAWAGRQPLAYDIVEEPAREGGGHHEAQRQRIICVYAGGGGVQR
jgi:hypothetical protein